MPKYVCNFDLEFSFNDKNAKLAENYLNNGNDTRLIQRDYNVSILSYHWYFQKNKGHIVVISNHPLTDEELKSLQQYTQGQVSDGVGDDFTAQSFTEVRNNQEANPEMDFSDQWGPYADYDIITLDNDTNDFQFILSH